MFHKVAGWELIFILPSTDAHFLKKLIFFGGCGGNEPPLGFM